MTAQQTRTAAPYWMSLPALALFALIVLVPIVMTVMLSFHDWGQYKGIEPVFILKNWQEVIADDYFHEVLLRTLRIALAVTLITALFGTPEAIILHRMRSPWRGIFLLVVLGGAVGGRALFLWASKVVLEGHGGQAVSGR